MITRVENSGSKYNDPLSLVDRGVLEKSALVHKLLDQVQQVLPKHFSQPRFIQASLGFNHTIRADCRNEGCRSRLIVYVIRDESNSLLHFDKCTPDQKPKLTNDRSDATGQMCTDCQAYFHPQQS